jgi:hypothetical protein
VTPANRRFLRGFPARPARAASQPASHQLHDHVDFTESEESGVVIRPSAGMFRARLGDLGRGFPTTACRRLPAGPGRIYRRPECVG